MTHKCWPVCGSAKSWIFPSPRPSLSGFEIFSPFFFFLAAQVSNLLEISVVHYLCQLFHVLKPHSSADIGGKLSVCVRLCALSRSVMFNFLQPHMAVTRQAPLSRRFSRQDYWSGLLFPSLADPGIEPTSPASPALTGDHCITWEAPMLSIYSSRSLPLA